MFGDAPAEGGDYTRLVAGPVEGFLALAGLVDVEAERTRLGKAIADARKALDACQIKLSKPQFRERAPAEVVAREEQKAAELAEKVAKLEAQLQELG